MSLWTAGHNDREFCSSSSSSPSCVTQKTKQRKVIKFRKNVYIHNATRLDMFMFGLLEVKQQQIAPGHTLQWGHKKQCNSQVVRATHVNENLYA